ncbi:unnamed protein product, partial [Oncorhynchus mykiss]
ISLPPSLSLHPSISLPPSFHLSPSISLPPSFYLSLPPSISLPPSFHLSPSILPSLSLHLSPPSFISRSLIPPSLSLHLSPSILPSLSLHPSLEPEDRHRSQVAPQDMSMTLLPGEEREIEMEVFEPAKGPLDLYILMDFSNSMKDDLDNLKRMGAELADLVGKLSDDYTIGFGKFVDKVVEPQTDMRPIKLAQPWPNSDPPFSFRNVITLTPDLQSFTQKLQKERISGNLDAPEGGFDAILQATVCGKGEAAIFGVPFGMFDYLKLVKLTDAPLWALLARETHVYVAKASEKTINKSEKTQNNINKKQLEMISKHCTQQSFKKIKTFQVLAMLDLFSNSLWVYGLWEIPVSNGVIHLIGVQLRSDYGDLSIARLYSTESVHSQGLSSFWVSQSVQVFCPCIVTIFFMNDLTPPLSQGVCNGRGVCKCGRCECQDSGLAMTPTCEANFQAQLGMCEDKRSCVQCQAWKTGEKKDSDQCDQCQFKVVMVDELKENKEVIEACSFRDEDDDCTYHYTVDYPEDQTDKELEVQVLKKKDCPPAGFLWLIPLIMFLMLLLGLLLLCCWKYCACCKACLALLPCCGRGRMVGFKEDQYMLRQSLLTSDHLDTPLVRTGPPKSTDVVRWKITDNVHRSPNHPLAQVQPNPKETIQFPLSLRLNRLFTESLSHPDARDTEMLRREVDDNLNEVYKHVPGAQRVQNTKFRLQRNAGKRKDHTIVDTVVSAPRSSYPDIVKLTERNVQSGNFQDLKVVPGYYTVATDREAAGAVEFQEGVETVDVRVPLFIKEDDDDKKQLQVEAVDVPLGIAEIGKRFVNITIIKEHAKSIMSFLQPSYTYSRQDRVANIPISREIIEDGHTQVTYRTRDLTAKDKKDYVTVDGELSYGPGETQQTVPVRLLELGEGDGLLKDTQVKQFVMDLSNPRQGAKLGRYPRTTVTITDQPEPSVMMFMKSTQNFSTADPTYSIPVVRTRNQEGPATVHWKTRNAKRFELSGPLKFSPGETEKNIVIDPRPHPGPVKPEMFQLELFDPSTNAAVGERKTTMVTITDGEIAQKQQQGKDFINRTAMSPGGRLFSPTNVKAKATGPRNIRLNWDPLGSPLGYKVKYWIYGDPETDGQVIDVKTTHAELTNLYPFCDYEMKVCGYNALGNGNYSDMVPCQTLEDVPSEPGRLAFNVISPTVTQVSWAEPAETNGVITNYEVLYTPINDNTKPMGVAKKVKIDNPKKRMLLIENLQSAQTYCYKVRAKNSVGWGPFREATINLASQPVRPMSIPIIPDIPIVDAEAGDEYDGYLMYSSEVLRSPTGSKRPSVSDEGGASSTLLSLFLHSFFLLFLPLSSFFLFICFVPPLSLSLSEVSFKKLTFILHLMRSSEYFLVHGFGFYHASLHTSLYFLVHGFGFYHASLHTSLYFLVHGFGFYHASLHTSLYFLLHGFFPRANTSTDETPRPSRAQTPSLKGEDHLPGVLDSQTRQTDRQKDSMPATVHGSHQPPKQLQSLIISMRLSSRLPSALKLPPGSTLIPTPAAPRDLPPHRGFQASTAPPPVDDRGQAFPGACSPFTLSTPSAPGPLVFTALSPEALQLSWDKPRKPNGDILGYVVTCEQLHGGGDMRSFQVSGNSAETSLTVPDLSENMPYKFKVQARTTQGFGPEREGIITIESQEGGGMSQYSSQSLTKRDVFQLPTEVSTHSNVTHTMINDPYFSGDGMMMTSQHTETSGMVTRHVTKEVVQRSMQVAGSSSVTKKVERSFYEA